MTDLDDRAEALIVAADRAQHMAEERGETFDPASVTGPTTIYRIDGTGAVVR